MYFSNMFTPHTLYEINKMQIFCINLVALKISLLELSPTISPLPISQSEQKIVRLQTILTTATVVLKGNLENRSVSAML